MRSAVSGDALNAIDNAVFGVASPPASCAGTKVFGFQRERMSGGVSRRRRTRCVEIQLSCERMMTV